MTVKWLIGFAIGAINAIIVIVVIELLKEK